MMFGVAIFSIAGGAMATAYVFSLRSFQALSNYSILDQQNREAMDLLTREIRQAWYVSAKDSRTLTLVDGNRGTTVYSFNPTTQQFTRQANGVTSVLLNNCSLINFTLATRVPNTNVNDQNYYTDIYTTADVNEAKVVNLSWKTRRELPGGVGQSENIQTARIVIRKQQLIQ
jgi:hypothetical protein